MLLRGPQRYQEPNGSASYKDNSLTAVLSLQPKGCFVLLYFDSFGVTLGRTPGTRLIVIDVPAVLHGPYSAGY